MDVINRRCAGLDVHKASVSVCLRVIDDTGEIRKIVRTYKTVTRELSTLVRWLTNESVTHVAMESTGVYWKPIFNVLEGHFEVLLCNAHHVKQVPGRKTDVKDCEWLAQLLQHGLLRRSFIPPKPVRELRDLTRDRAKLTEQRTAVANRLHMILEDANVKVATVASDILGVSGRDMLEAIVKGEQNPQRLAELAQGRMRSKIPQLEPSLEGFITDHHRFQLRMKLDHLNFLNGQIAELDRRIQELMKKADAATPPRKSEAGPLFASTNGEEDASPLPFVSRCGS